MSSSGTSLAFQRAKEHSNRSSGVKVMVKTVKLGRLKKCGAVVPLWLSGTKKLVPLVGR